MMDLSAGNLSVSICFPLYKDEKTVRLVAEKALRLLSSLCDQY